MEPAEPDPVELLEPVVPVEPVDPVEPVEPDPVELLEPVDPVEPVDERTNGMEGETALRPDDAPIESLTTHDPSREDGPVDDIVVDEARNHLASPEHDPGEALVDHASTTTAIPVPDADPTEVVATEHLLMPRAPAETPARETDPRPEPEPARDPEPAREPEPVEPQAPLDPTRDHERPTGHESVADPEPQPAMEPAPEPEPEPAPEPEPEPEPAPEPAHAPEPQLTDARTDDTEPTDAPNPSSGPVSAPYTEPEVQAPIQVPIAAARPPELFEPGALAEPPEEATVVDLRQVVDHPGPGQPAQPTTDPVHQAPDPVHQAPEPTLRSPDLVHQAPEPAYGPPERPSARGAEGLRDDTYPPAPESGYEQPDPASTPPATGGMSLLDGPPGGWDQVYRRRRRQTITFLVGLLGVLAVGGLSWLVFSGVFSWPFGGTQNAATPVCTHSKPAPPRSITLHVYNGSPRAGLAGTLRRQLQGFGFVVQEIGNDPLEAKLRTPVEVRYGEGSVIAAQSTAAYFIGKARLVQDDRLDGTIDVIAGPAFTRVRTRKELPRALAAVTASLPLTCPPGATSTPTSSPTRTPSTGGTPQPGGTSAPSTKPSASPKR